MYRVEDLYFELVRDNLYFYQIQLSMHIVLVYIVFHRKIDALSYSPVKKFFCQNEYHLFKGTLSKKIRKHEKIRLSIFRIAMLQIHASPTQTVFFSGSIPLQPASMTVLDNNFEREAMLSLKHVNEVSKIIAPERSSYRHYGSITCYVTGRAFMIAVKEIFEKHQTFVNDFLF